MKSWHWLYCGHGQGYGILLFPIDRVLQVEKFKKEIIFHPAM